MYEAEGWLLPKERSRGAPGDTAALRKRNTCAPGRGGAVRHMLPATHDCAMLSRQTGIGSKHFSGASRISLLPEIT